MMTKDELLAWLMKGDVSIQFQAYRDLLDTNKPQLRKRIEQEGWGAKFLSRRHANGHWGRKFYQPKWTSTHYTLLDLKNLAIAPRNNAIKETLRIIFETEKGADGGINPSPGLTTSDVCINGMVLNYSSYFQMEQNHLRSVVDFILAEKMPDGGFNCQSNRKGAVHSSLHSTLSVLEGILEYRKNGYSYRLKELVKAEENSREFILMHKLFRSDHTGEIINPGFLKFYYPCRWYYDIFKALDYFQSANVKYDKRMEEALEIVRKKRNKSGQWLLPAAHPGQVHFTMEQAGKPSRWNTLRALRILKQYNAG